VSGKVEELKEKDLAKISQRGIVLLDFWASWCHACKIIAPHLDDLAKIWNDKVKFYKIDVTQDPGLAARLGIMSLPNILILVNGKVREQIIGTATKKAIEDKIKKVLS